MHDFAKKYLELLNGPLKGLNLTSIKDENEFFQKQVLDSVAPLDHSQFFSKALLKSSVLVDVGFGGGFPLLPLALRFPQIKCVGIEARAKKAEAVKFIAHECGINNVCTWHLRLEEILFDVPCALTFKAVGSIEDLLKKINAQVNVHAFFYKGPHLDELEGPETSKHPYKVSERIKYDLEGTDGRTFVTIHFVPRGTRPTQRGGDKALVKLSDLLLEF
jgi:16S rRNA (guanine527-N7)-methyltransferase